MKKFLYVISLFLAPLLTAGQPANPHLGNLHRSLSDARNDTARLKAYSDLGAYYTLEDRDSSGYYLEKAYSLAVALHLKLNEASILNLMGVLQMQQEKFAKSLEFYLRAMHIAKDPSIEKTIRQLSPGQSPASARMLEISKSYDLIGLLNAYTGNWTENIKNQMKYYREAEKYAIASGNQRQIATVTFHMGIAYKNAGKLDSALIFIKKAQSAFSALNDAQLGRSLIYLGETYEQMGNPDLAAHTLLQASAMLNQTNDYVHRGLAYTTLSRVYGLLSKTDSALYYAKESSRIFEKRRDPAWKRDAYNLIASHFDRLGKIDSATFYLKLAKSLSDSLSIEERKNLLAFQDVLIDEQIKLENLEKERIETREKIKISLLMSGIGVFLVIALLLYRNNRAKKKTNEMLQQRNVQIENTLHQLRSTQSKLIQSEKMASLGELTAGIAHEIQNPINFVNNFSEVSSELIDEMKEKINKGNYEEANAIANDVKHNLDKITHHGKRADSIVKGMLQHSRSSAGTKEPTDISALADEYLRLAYHGMRAKDKAFNASIKTAFEPNLPLVPVVAQDIGRVLLNLFNNAFYAVSEKQRAQGDGYQPELIVQVGWADNMPGATLYAGDGLNPQHVPRNAGSEIQNPRSIVIAIADNGNGIPNSIKDKIFQPFFTTKPTGQGTGLGLSLSYDIVTKGHGGELTVDTVDGKGSIFSIKLPLQ
jgi:signal transduction histidine kinase